MHAVRHSKRWTYRMQRSRGRILRHFVDGKSICGRPVMHSEDDYDPNWTLQEKYNSKAAALYRDKIVTEAEGKPWSISTSSARNHVPFTTRSQPSTKSSTSSASSASYSSYSNSASGFGSEGGGYQSGGGGGNGYQVPGYTKDQIDSHKEDFFSKRMSENASRPADLPPSQGGKYAGFGNSPYTPNSNDEYDSTMATLSTGWSTFALSATKFASKATEQATKLASKTAQKTKEFGQSVNDSVIKPTTEKVKDGTLMNDVGYQLSNLSTKMSSASMKGWRDLSSLWGEPKPGAIGSADTSPSEGTSLLSGGRGTRATDNNDTPLLQDYAADKDDDWSNWHEEDWGHDENNAPPKTDEWGSWNNSVPEVPEKKAATGTNDWGNNDDWGTPIKTAPKPTKTTTQKNKKNTKNSKKEPVVGNLLDFDSDISAGQTTAKNDTKSDWDNDNWAVDDDDEWEALEVERGLTSQTAAKAK